MFDCFLQTFTEFVSTWSFFMTDNSSLKVCRWLNRMLNIWAKDNSTEGRLSSYFLFVPFILPQHFLQSFWDPQRSLFEFASAELQFFAVNRKSCPFVWMGMNQYNILITACRRFPQWRLKEPLVQGWVFLCSLHISCDYILQEGCPHNFSQQ